MTVTICALIWSHPGSDERLHSTLAQSLSTVGIYGGTPVSLYRRKEGSIGPLEVLTIRWSSREVLDHFRETTDPEHTALTGTADMSHLVIVYEEDVRSSTISDAEFLRASSEPGATPVTVCCLVWSHAGQDLLLSAYANRALSNAESYGARVLQRLRRLPGSSGPLETQIIEFPSQELFEEYREAQRVDEYAHIRNTAIANWLIFPVESMLEFALPTL